MKSHTARSTDSPGPRAAGRSHEVCRPLSDNGRDPSSGKGEEASASVIWPADGLARFPPAPWRFGARHRRGRRAWRHRGRAWRRVFPIWRSTRNPHQETSVSVPQDSPTPGRTPLCAENRTGSASVPWRLPHHGFLPCGASARTPRRYNDCPGRTRQSHLRASRESRRRVLAARGPWIRERRPRGDIRKGSRKLRSQLQFPSARAKLCSCCDCSIEID